MERGNQDRLECNAAEICSLNNDKNAARDALLRNPTSRTLHGRYSSMRESVQRKQGGWRTTGGRGRRLRYRAMPILMMQRSSMKR